MDNFAQRWLLQYAIEREESRKGYVYNEHDARVAKKMLKEIRKLGYPVHYVAELDMCRINGISSILERYIHLFQSECTRAYLLDNLIEDKPADCDKLVLSLYRHFRGLPDTEPILANRTSAFICFRYDHAFHKLKSRRIKHELLEIVKSPENADEFAFTFQMLASWKMPEMETLSKHYLLHGSSITAAEFGLTHPDENFLTVRLPLIQQELRFRGIGGLRYFPSEENIALLRPLLDDASKDIRLAAASSLEKMQKKLQKSLE